ncbi:MAG: hypothetical protein RIC80_07495 [Cyclobacteriaceae bacterium]
MKSIHLAIIAAMLIASCSQPGNENKKEETVETETANPPAPGFDEAGSDAQAIAIADEVMLAMGGRKAWDDTKLLSWDFFGARKLLWNKHTGDVRIESGRDDLKIIMNINTKEGRVYKNGSEFSDNDSVDFYLNRGERIWINDAYWLVMPYKLKDSGVTLKYLREDTTATGDAADVLQLTFDNVGVTPENIYEVYVDKYSRLVTQWAYYRESGQEEPNFITPWGEYARYGEIMLSGDRGERDLTDISVLDIVPEKAFSSFDNYQL